MIMPTSIYGTLMLHLHEKMALIALSLLSMHSSKALILTL